MSADPRYLLGSFELLPERRQLLWQGQPVKLGGRAFDLLVALVEGRERLQTKDELLQRVWGPVCVEEANLAVHVVALRKLLGRAAIATVAGRGYRFVQAVTLVDGARSLPAPPPATSKPGRVPQRSDTLHGRGADVQALRALLAKHELVTLVGTGGVGKTRLAQHLAQELQRQFAEGVWWVELAALDAPELVGPTVARALGCTLGAAGDALAAIVGALQTGPALVVLDNAEHLLDAVRALAAALRARLPQTRLLVTSQAPLRLEGEQILRLLPLSVPEDDTQQALQASGAVALFEARAGAQGVVFGPEPDRAAAVADICRRLDGVPLAIELAVARLPLLGLQGLRQRLDARFRLLTANPKAGLPRHQTLRATLDWSHDLLSAADRRVYRRLGVFAGGFTLEAAQQVAGDETLDEWAVLHSLGTLVERSLVLAEGEPTPRCRLLETTRLHALEKLDAAGETAALRERQARALDRMLQVTHDDERLWRTPPASPEMLRREVDNARAALEWVQGCDDDALAASLAAGCSHVFLAASLNAEYVQRVLPLRERVHDGVPGAVAALFWARLALACSRNAHPAGLDAGQRAAALYRTRGDTGRLYDALTWTVAIGSRHGQTLALGSLVAEAEALEQPDWPPALRSSFQWARHRWLLMQGRIEEARACAQAQAELLALGGHWATHVAWGANVADCEIALGRIDAAEAHARAALQALDDLGIDENLVGHVMDALMLALTLQRRAAEAIDIGRRARRLLVREGDELRLLDTLALNACTQQRWADAARISGHVDGAMAASGETRWPAAEQRRGVLAWQLGAALPAAELQRHRQAGAALAREQVFALAFANGGRNVTVV